MVVSSAKFAAKFGAKLLTGIKAGFNGVYASVKAGFAKGLVTWGSIGKAAGLNAAWNGIQIARAGGKFSDILKGMARGAVIGAIGAVVGGFMHGFGAGVGSVASGGSSLSGTVLHAAAHGVSGGAMAAANGGSFKDGFVGGLAGFLLSPTPGSSLGDMEGLQGVAVRTAMAAVTGGIASKLSGGSFADGAWSTAFFHLFNEELAIDDPDVVRMEGLAKNGRGKRAFLIDRSVPGDIESGVASGQAFWDNAQKLFPGSYFYDTSRPNWRSDFTKFVEAYGQFDIIGIVNHGSDGRQWLNYSVNVTRCTL